MTKPNWPPPQRGDFSLCRFPHDEDPSQPGPYPRPILVLDVSADNTEVLVCYGSGQAHHKTQATLQSHEFAIFDESHLVGAGLNEATVFNLLRVARLPYNEQWFYRAPSRTSPKVGSMKQCKSLRPNLFAAMISAGHSSLLPPAVSCNGS